MKTGLWKVRMVRWLTDRVSPTVIVKSSFDYTLPRSWSDMLDNLEETTDEEYRHSALTTVMQHCIDECGKSGFCPEDLISPE